MLISACPLGMRYWEDRATTNDPLPWFCSWPTSGINIGYEYYDPAYEDYWVSVDHGYTVVGLSYPNPGNASATFTKELSAIPNKIQANISILSDVGASDLSATYLLCEVYRTSSSNTRYSLDYFYSDKPDYGNVPTSIVRLKIYEESSLIYSEILVSAVSASPFPDSRYYWSFNGKLSVVQISASNVEIYMNDTLKYTTSSSLHDLGKYAKFVLDRKSVV